MNCGGDATAHFNAGGGLAVDGLPTGRPKPTVLIAVPENFYL